MRHAPRRPERASGVRPSICCSFPLRKTPAPFAEDRSRSSAVRAAPPPGPGAAGGRAARRRRPGAGPGARSRRRRRRRPRVRRRGRGAAPAHGLGRGALGVVAARHRDHQLGPRGRHLVPVRRARLLARRPSRSSPPASSIICGTQWPPTNTGSSHSSAATRGRRRAGRRPADRVDPRGRLRRPAARPLRRRPPRPPGASRRPAPRRASRGRARSLGLRRSRSATACTSSKDTAQTAQTAWVTIRSASSCSSSSSSSS